MKIGIVGLGLIGGSLGIDLKSLGFEVLGISRREKTCCRALELKIVDEASVNLSLLRKAELVFICTPIAAIASTVRQVVPYLNPNAILTDVGSVKVPVLESCAPLWSNFVGGHPMAGTAYQGIEAAQRHLFAGTPYVITPRSDTPLVAIRRLEEVVRSLGSVVYICTPWEHDKAVAWISHLPLMVSSNLISASMQERDIGVLRLAQKLASSGFRDTSRVGGGNPELGVMIARYNRVALLEVLKEYQQSLQELIEVVEKENWPVLEEKLLNTQQQRPLFVD